jgi:hypothetical protein
MQWFYDGQIRRYITQTIRVFSNFVVKYGDGTLHQIPVMYGDADRQVASILRNNSENKVNSIPRISVYVTELKLDRDRVADQSYVGKMHFRERDIVNGSYTQGQGKNYTVERLMPTPFSLKMKVDIWSANTDQKLQILEQILVLFNPSLELQTTDNYIDWTSLSVLNLNDISWSSRQVPVGNSASGDPIEVASLTVETPIWVSPPVKVKHLGVITKIIAGIYDKTVTSGSYIDGLGADPIQGTTTLTDLVSTVITTAIPYNILVYGNQAKLLGPTEPVRPHEPTLDVTVKLGPDINWQEMFSQQPGKYTAGSSRIYLTQANGTQIVGTFAINPLDESILQINWNLDSLVTNTGIDSSGYLDTNVAHYNAAGSYRPNSPGTFDAIINPQTYNPKRPLGSEQSDLTVAVGTRFLLVEDIGDVNNVDGADAWKSNSGADFVAMANDIVEWSGSAWHVIFNSSQETETMVWQTNIYTGVQYLWNGVSWIKSFEGEYSSDKWKIVL